MIFKHHANNERELKAHSKDKPPVPSWPKYALPAILGAVLILATAGIVYAAGFTAANNGNWNIGTTWVASGGCTSSCVQGVNYPGPSDTATISNKTVTLNTNQSVGSTTISATGILNLGTFILSVYNNFSNTGTLNANTGTVNFVGLGQWSIGTSTFYNLTKQATSSPDTIYFGLSTTTISNNLILTGTATSTLSVRAGEYKYLSTVGASYNTSGYINGASNIALDPSDNIYISQNISSGHVGIVELNSSGNYVTALGTSTGSGGGQFVNNSAVGGLAYSTSTNDLYVADNSNNRIQVFNSSGSFLEAFGWGVLDGASSSEVCTTTCQAGSAGSGNGQFHTPAAVAVDAAGNLYVTDKANQRVEKFNSSGSYVAQWGSNATTTGNFTSPTGIAVDNANGWIYVVDGNSTWPRVEKFNLSGSFISQIPAFGTYGGTGGNGKFSQPQAVAVDSSGNLYVTDLEGGGELVQKFNSSGTFLSQWGGQGTTTGTFSSIVGIAVDPSNNIYIGDGSGGSPGNYRIQVFNSSGSFISQEGTSSTAGGVLLTPVGLTVDSSGNTYVAEQANNRIQEFNSSGNFVKTFGWGVASSTVAFQTCTVGCRAGTSGSGNGQFNFFFSVLNGLAEDSSDNLYVVDGNNKRIQEFNSSGNYVTKWGSAGTGVSQFSTPQGIAIDSNNNWIYVSDSGQNRIEKFDMSGNFISMFGWGVTDGGSSFETCTSSCQVGVFGSGNGQFHTPEGVGIDSSGNVYVADNANNRIEKFSSSGSYVAQYALSFAPINISIDGSGNMLVVGNNLVSTLNPNGVLSTQFGSGLLSAPLGITIDNQGNVYVANNSQSGSVGNLVQKFHALSVINPLGPVTAQYLNVKDSYNASTTNINCTNCTNAGNNTGWTFNTLTTPTLSTPTTTAITTTGVTFQDTMTADGGASSTVEGFNYGTSISYGSATSTTGTYGVGTFSMTVTGLTCNTLITLTPMPPIPKGREPVAIRPSPQHPVRF